MKKQNHLFQGLHTFILLWSTQAFSTLGSSMTSYALILWSYQQKGSALTTALLSVCSYAPYVLLSIFAGALSDRWNKKYTMLVCDSMAALSTVFILVLLLTGHLRIWHLYLINTLNGLMNTVQQPASDVAVSLLTPQNQYQRVGGMRSFSNSLVTILSPVIASTIFAFWGLTAVIAFDLLTFTAAFITLAFFIKIPDQIRKEEDKEPSLLKASREGLNYLKCNRGILGLILFLSAINLTASIYNAALPAMLLSRNGGSPSALGLVNACSGLANLAGSILISFGHPPKSRVRAICNSLLFSMSTENFFLALGQSTPLWCLGAILGWICIPVMNTNLEVILRSNIPIALQGRVYSVRNALQFFTIPIGYLLGGILVDKVFEPFMAGRPTGSIFLQILGSGKGSGAALLFLLLGFIGSATCLLFRRNKYIWELE